MRAWGVSPNETRGFYANKRGMGDIQSPRNNIYYKSKHSVDSPGREVYWLVSTLNNFTRICYHMDLTIIKI
jgi:hypothetical protein